MNTKDLVSLLLDAGMGATALYTVKQLKVAVEALRDMVKELKAGHDNHENRLKDLEKAA